MNTSETQWKKSTFVSAAHVLHRPRNSARHGKRLTGIVRANRVQVKETPVPIGATAAEKIQIVPITQNGQVKALRVSCACGCESTFDIQYGAGEANENQHINAGSMHPGPDGQRMHDTTEYAA